MHGELLSQDVLIDVATRMKGNVVLYHARWIVSIVNGQYFNSCAMSRQIPASSYLPDSCTISASIQWKRPRFKKYGVNHTVVISWMSRLTMLQKWSRSIGMVHA